MEKGETQGQRRCKERMTQNLGAVKESKCIHSLIDEAYDMEE